MKYALIKYMLTNYVLKPSSVTSPNNLYCSQYIAYDVYIIINVFFHSKNYHHLIFLWYCITYLWVFFFLSVQ